MDCKNKKNNQNTAIERKLQITSNKIKKARKNQENIKKETAEFEEIRKLLKETVDLSLVTEPNTNQKVTNKHFVDSTITEITPGLNIFLDELIFSLFNKDECCLKNFIDCQEQIEFLGINRENCCEYWFRNFIAYRIYESFDCDEKKCASISLYVLYLMSVHDDPAFVSACYDFLKFHVFVLQIKDLFPIFVNFGAKREDLFDYKEEEILKRFQKKKNVTEEVCEKPGFPYFNMEMVGRIILHYITKNFISLSPDIKLLVKGLIKITIDLKIQSSSLLPLYSTLVTTLCFKGKKEFPLKEIVSWVHLEKEHLVNQLEICRVVSKQIFPDLHEVLVLKTISKIIKLRNYFDKIPVKIDYIKLILKKLIIKELSSLEVYSLLHLINGLLPGITASIEDSVEINCILASLVRKISIKEDSVDLTIQKLEIAKVGNLVTNNVNNRFVVGEKSAAKIIINAQK